ncbi:PREDICTED: uncharacterized protein LOC109351862 isoform X2 [Lupinus angustifolius]|uniref:uncharacterized protein LOC109351862 isoform X2 n=1 Tax=Lupinus angustifolius TaxID=3871 RepID=UPI00092E8A4B|nr:PREDICTED: uncharacterized protein LOC109351862 isoform X2 [Lupinus angustifolius]
MITMDLKGMTWVGNLYHEFENICLEAEDIIYQDTVNYIENQMQAVSESVKKLYADVMQDLLPPSSCDLDENVASELHTDQDTYAGFCKKPDQGFKETPLKADANQTTKDSRINHDVDNDTIHPASYDGTCETNVVTPSSGDSVKGNNFISHSAQCVQSMDIKSDLAIDENQENKKMVATMISDEITLAEPNRCRTSQSCDLSNENQNSPVSDSKAASTEVTLLFASAADCCYEIKNASTEEIPDDPVLVESHGEKQMNTCYSSGVLFGEPDSFYMDRTIYSDDCYSTVLLSHQGTKIDTFEEQDHKAMQQDQLKLEETCVMVTGDELQLVHKQGGYLKTNKKWRPSFSLSKKSARKQEYKELALWHGNNEEVKGDCMENSDPTLLENQEKLLFPTMSEPEWEIL